MNANWSDYEKFLKPIHLKGGECALTITRITEEDTHPRPGETVKAAVLWFRELPFGLIVTPTNRQTLIELYGDEIKNCLGKPIAVKAVDVKVGGKTKQPIRIQKKRPNAPSIDPGTGEIVPPLGEGGPEQPAETPAGHAAPASARCDGLRGCVSEPESTGELEPKSEPEMTPIEILPATEAQFLGWLKHHNINGQETNQALGMDAKSYLRKHPGTTWADVTRIVAAALPEPNATLPPRP